jgi:predicted nucleotidyltransferase
MNQFYQPWKRDIRNWAKLHDHVREIWLFGSRARGVAKPESDVDLALILMPPGRFGSTPLGSYLALADKWQRALERIVGRHVRLTLPNVLWRRHGQQ